MEILIYCISLYIEYSKTEQNIQNRTYATFYTTLYYINQY